MSILATLNMLFLKVVGFLLSAVLVWTVPASSAANFAPKDEAGLKLQVSLIADAHMQSFEYSGFQELSKSLRDIAGSKVKQDALVFVGDNTMNGQAFEYMMFYGILSHYNKASAKNTLLAMGNHDLNIGAYKPADAIARHNFFLRSYNGLQNDKSYYSKVISGCTFVMLGGEGPGETTITQAQLDFLSSAMAAAEAGKPVFVFMHQPLGGPALAILKLYPNVFLFNGHWHTPLDTWDDGGVTRVNLPGLHSHESGAYAGEGVQLEVYANKVLLRERNYMTGAWGGEIEIALV